MAQIMLLSGFGCIQMDILKAKAMVRRNPGVLGIKPEQTGDAEATMAFSYVVAAGPVLGAAIAIAA